MLIRMADFLEPHFGCRSSCANLAPMVRMDPLVDLLDSKVISGGIASILQVPDPVQEAVEIEYPDDAIMQVFALLGAVVRRDPHLRGSAEEGTFPVDSPDWAQAYCKIVTFIVWLFSDDRIQDRLGKGDQLGARCLRLIGSPNEPGLTDALVLERSLLFAFITGLGFSQMMKLHREPLDSVLSLHPDLMIFDMLAALTSCAGLSDAYCKAAGLMASCLSSTAAKCGRLGHEREQQRWQATADSVMRVNEFAALASHSPPQMKKYGKEKVAERFEQQLNLALQLLGFFTRPVMCGERYVDILCLTDQKPPKAVLVEAKTSAKPYKLPAADQRALLEYAQRDIPVRLRLICIVGPKPADSMARRLRKLEKKVGIPVRYCEAALVVFLLRAPKRVALKDLVRALISADQIISQTDLESMLSKSGEKSSAWTALTRFRE
jgi:hypothetical protein